MAGKTSLVWSMQRSKRVLSKRCESSKLDDTTKVFRVCEADVDAESMLVFHDFGGQAIYHFGYPLSSLSQFVPMLVIDIAKFDELVTKHGVESACEMVCFDWLAHLYLSCPQAGPPLVVLAHCDGLSSEICRERKTLLLDAAEKLRKRITEEERVMAPLTSPFFLMKSFCDTSQPLLRRHKQLLFSKASSQSEINDLKRLLVCIGQPLLTEIPDIWYVMMFLIAKETDKPYLTLKVLEGLFSDDKEHIILQYLHEIGRVMWYKKRKLLGGIVFHRIDLLTKIVELVLDHSG